VDTAQCYETNIYPRYALNVPVRQKAFVTVEPHALVVTYGENDLRFGTGVEKLFPEVVAW